ncbi:MAG: cytochrome c family protein [Chelatococcus sp.]|uniref:c-type cytochrome n=1 Tax=Chelatococcus sp. TaxID=1953771 RepID=UPI0025C0E95F|nr:cytochrome c family protein [Chelatococcus sp.]MBX3539704.1 cytochrome c family protein [Chelatococcus sp.]
MRWAFPAIVLACAAGVAALGSAPSAYAQDAAAGATVFNKCRACHQVGEGARNLVGPQLNGIIGRPAATVPGYTYSPALKEAGITWDDANLKHWLQNPRDFLRGTKMIFSGLPKDEDVDNLLTYLKSFDRDGKRVR